MFCRAGRNSRAGRLRTRAAVPLRTVPRRLPAYGSSIGQLMRDRPRAASRTAPTVDESTDYITSPVAGSRRTTTLALPPARGRFC